MIPRGPKKIDGEDFLFTNLNFDYCSVGPKYEKVQIIPENPLNFDAQDYLFTTAPSNSKQARETGKFCSFYDDWL